MIYSIVLAVFVLILVMLRKQSPETIVISGPIPLGKARICPEHDSLFAEMRCPYCGSDGIAVGYTLNNEMFKHPALRLKK